MDDFDPHIHVDAALHADIHTRGMMAATFGLAADLPSHATTGCGLRVPYVTTSTAPSKVTCLACREYAHRRYRELADNVKRVTGAPGVGAEIRARSARAVEEYLDLARRFAAP